MKRLLTSLLVVMITTACSHTEEPTPTEDQHSHADQEVKTEIKDAKVLASHLDVPWDIIKHGNAFYVSERGGHIVKLTSDGQKVDMPLRLDQDIVHFGEGGLLGFVLDPHFNNNALAYVYHTYREKGTVLNRIVQIKKEDQHWVEQTELLSDIPGGAIHNGGRLDIGPDGYLYATVGDAGEKVNAQKLSSLSGKVLRMTRDGHIPKSNPFTNSYIYSFGHRNPQGLAWGDQGKLYSAEHGSSAHDEINVIRPGKNYGWPMIQGDETNEDMVTPLFHSGETTWAPSGLSYYNDRLYVAGLAGEQLRMFNLNQHTTKVIYKGIGRIRDILITDGIMYLITNNTDGRGTPDEDDDHLLRLKLSSISNKVAQ